MSLKIYEKSRVLESSLSNETFKPWPRPHMTLAVGGTDKLESRADPWEAVFDWNLQAVLVADSVDPDGNCHRTELLFYQRI